MKGIEKMTKGVEKMTKGKKRKQELLDIAYNLFLQKGYENTSVDEIILNAQIAKGTFYYYFKTKEQMLEEVIDRMVEEETKQAEAVLGMPISTLEKIPVVLGSFQPKVEENTIVTALNQPENLLLHDKISRKIQESAVPILSQLVEEGNKEGIFRCDHIPSRVKMLLILSNKLFDDSSFDMEDVEVFIDLAEKNLGAKNGAMGFLKTFIVGQ